ncbi:MAG: PadR family transcriptional regulator [Acidobacteriota bacterium]
MSQRLGDFELLLMLSLHRLGERGYGAAAAREIEERTGRTVSLGAVYKTLQRLSDKGLLDSKIGAPEKRRGGRRRKEYRLTGLGQAELQSTLADLDSMRSGLRLPKAEPGEAQ